MIVVDTSVWIDFLRRVVTPETTLIRSGQVKPETLIVGDIVLLEVLMGAASPKQAELLSTLLSHFHQEAMLSPAMAPTVAENYRRLRTVGVKIGKATDLIIGSFCVARGYRLLTSDRGFQPMAEHLGLQLA